MGYFSSGSEGYDYQEALCNRCVHDVNQNCPVWMLHLLDNYEGANDPEYYLHQLIPFEKGFNKKCRLFYPRPEGPDGEPQCAECWRREAEQSGQTSLIGGE